jgi:hypothetical protein
MLLWQNLIKNPKFKVQSSNQVQRSKIIEVLAFVLDLNFESLGFEL